MKLNVTLDGEIEKQFQEVKEHVGAKANSNVLRYIIGKEYERIQSERVKRIFVPAEDYEFYEEQAKKRGQTVDEYVQELMQDFIEKVKANPGGFKRGEHKATEN